MAKFRLVFNSPWPLVGEVRKPGEILMEGVSPIPGVTPEKIINAIRQGVISIEPAEKQAGKRK